MPCIDAGQFTHFLHEGACRSHTDRNGLGERLPEGPLQPVGGVLRHFRIEHDVEVCFRQPRQIGRSRTLRRHHVHFDLEVGQKAQDFRYVVPIAEAQRCRAKNIAARALTGSPLRARHAGGRRLGARISAHELIECFSRAPVLFLLIGRQIERNDRAIEGKRLGEPARIVLDQFRRARGPDDHRFGLEALIRRPRR